MFDDTLRVITKKSRSYRSFLTLPYLAAAIITVLLGVIGLLALKIYGTPDVKIPTDIAQQVSHPIYTPRSLPEGYKILEDSFTNSEEALIFRAENSSGSSIIFTEQKRPKDFDFDQFHQGQMENATVLEGTPYPSVVGKAPTGQKLLSIVTDTTWILVTTAAPLSQDNFQNIANSIKKH